MSNENELKLRITAEDAASAAFEKVKAAEEALTNSGKGLATGVPAMEEATNKYIISTEAEYLAVVQAHEALRARIPIMAAAGKATEDMTAALNNLDAALSTDTALTIAQNYEGKQWLATRLEQIAAAEADTVVTKQNTTAHEANALAAGMSATSMREFVVIARELERGNFSRLPGSISILAQSFGLLGALFNPITLGLIGVGAALYELVEHMNAADAKAQELADNMSIMDSVLSDADGAKAQADAFGAMAEKGQAAAESTNALVAASKALREETEDANQNLSQATRDEIEENDARKKELLEQVKRDVQSGKLTHGQGENRTAQINNEFQFQNDQAKSKDEQGQIDNLKKERTSQQDIADAANAKIEAAKLKADHDADAALVAKNKAEEAKKEHEEEINFDKKNIQPSDEGVLHSFADMVTFGLTAPAEISGADQQKAIGREMLLRKNAVQDEGTAADAETKANQSKADYAALKTGLDGATGAVNELNRKITNLETSHTEADKHRNTMEDFGDREQQGVGQDVIRGDATNALKVDKTTADAVKSGRQVSSDAAQRLMQDASAIAGHAVNLQDAATVIERGAQNVSAFMVQLSRLTAAFSRLSPDSLTDLERRIDKLEAQMGHASNFNHQ